MKDEKTIRKNLSSIFRMFTLVFQNGRKDCIYVFAVCIVTTCMYPVILELDYSIVSLIEKDIKQNDIIVACILIIVLIGASGIFQITRYSNILLFEKLQIKVGTALMNKVYTQVSFLPHSYFDNPDNVAKLKRITLFSQDSMLTQNVVHFISAICNTISVILIFPVLYRTGIEVFFMIGIISVINNIFNFDEGYLKWEFQKKQEKNNIRREKIQSHFFDKDSIMEMRMLNSSGFLQSKWGQLEEKLYEESFAFNTKIERRRLKFNIIKTMLRSVPLFYILWKLSLGNADIAVVFLVWQTQDQLNSVVSSIFDEFKAVYYSVEYINELCNFLDEDIHDDEVVNNNPQEMLKMENVQFSYNGSDNVLHGIDLVIHPGEKIAIVGENGAGKTTLVKILAGLYNITEGTLIKKIKKNEIGAVWQDYIKFELTLRESIGLGSIENINNDLLIKDMIKQLKLDDLHIDLDDVVGRAFDTDGIIPSGGQWQKIAIARAMLGNKKLLILDEPTASLDPISEVEIYSCIKQLFRNETVIFVSHRVGFANLADRVIVVADGHIVENGEHAVLLKKKGYYYKFYSEQLKWYKR